MDCPIIEIKFITPNHQRFGECGDFFYDSSEHKLIIFVNRMGSWKSELAVAIHEAVEAVACLADGVDQTDIDLHDKLFYRMGKDGQAGDDKDAPYLKQHIAATFVEREVCSQLGLPWEQHEKHCDG